MADQVTDAKTIAKQNIGTMGRTQQARGTPAEQQKAFVRQRFAEAGIKITEEMDGAISKIFANAQGKENEITTVLVKLAENQVHKRQDLQAEQARKAMDILSGPEQTKANIAGMAVGLATFARLFGANEFAEMVEGKANEILRTVKVPLNVSGIEDGNKEMMQNLKDVLGVVQAAPGANTGLAGANRFLQSAPVPTTIDSYPEPSTAPAAAARVSTSTADKPVTWSSLSEAATKAGLNKTGLESLHRAFDLSKSLTTSGNNEAVDAPSEKMMLIRAVGKDLTGADKKTTAAIINFVNDPSAPAPKPQ